MYAAWWRAKPVAVKKFTCAALPLSWLVLQRFACKSSTLLNSPSGCRTTHSVDDKNSKIDFCDLVLKARQVFVDKAAAFKHELLTHGHRYAADGLHEVQMHLCAGRHPNVVELKALAQQGSALYMVMEYFPRYACACVN